MTSFKLIFKFKKFIFKFKNFLLIYLTAPFIVIPAKLCFNEPRCTIRIDISRTLTVLVTTVFLKMSPRVQNMYVKKIS